jgi:hypothetical protein
MNAHHHGLKAEIGLVPIVNGQRTEIFICGVADNSAGNLFLCAQCRHTFDGPGPGGGEMAAASEIRSALE